MWPAEHAHLHLQADQTVAGREFSDPAHTGRRRRDARAAARRRSRAPPPGRASAALRFADEIGEHSHRRPRLGRARDARGRPRSSASSARRATMSTTRRSSTLEQRHRRARGRVPGLLAYHNAQLADGQWGNLVVFASPRTRRRSPADAVHASGGRAHARHYASLRLHRGVRRGRLPGRGRGAHPRDALPRLRRDAAPGAPCAPTPERPGSRERRALARRVERLAGELAAGAVLAAHGAARVADAGQAEHAAERDERRRRCRCRRGTRAPTAASHGAGDLGAGRPRDRRARASGCAPRSTARAPAGVSGCPASRVVERRAELRGDDRAERGDARAARRRARSRC